MQNAEGKSEQKGADDAVDPETGLRPSDRERLKQRLVEAREAVLTRLQAQRSAVSQGESQLADEMDQASQAQDMGDRLHRADKQRELLTDLNDALAKFEDGSYGLCEGTDEPIGLARLTAQPWARYTVAYQEQLEREERERGR